MLLIFLYVRSFDITYYPQFNIPSISYNVHYNTVLIVTSCTMYMYVLIVFDIYFWFTMDRFYCKQYNRKYIMFMMYYFETHQYL